jgi:hypothetical protein
MYITINIFRMAEWLRKQQERTSLSELCAKYDDLCNQRKLLEEELQIEVLANARVIGIRNSFNRYLPELGMTTTGVAKFQRLINQVRPEVIIVEECGETLESSLLPAFSDATKVTTSYLRSNLRSISF